MECSFVSEKVSELKNTDELRLFHCSAAETVVHFVCVRLETLAPTNQYVNNPNMLSLNNVGSLPPQCTLWPPATAASLNTFLQAINRSGPGAFSS